MDYKTNILLILSQFDSNWFPVKLYAYFGNVSLAHTTIYNSPLSYLTDLYYYGFLTLSGTLL